VLKAALIAVMTHLDALDSTQTAQRREVLLYLLSLILYRRPTEEHQELVALVERHTPDMELETMVQSMAEALMERGIAQGETRAKQTALLKLLQFRFDAIPQALTHQITAIRSVARLDTLVEQGLTAQTLEDIDWQNHDR